MKPKKVSKSALTFGDVAGLMPNIYSIPDEFSNFNSTNKWVKWQADWFFHGLEKYPTPKEGIDIDMAMRHLAAIQRSFEPKHEHKQAAVAYLASQWFEEV